MDMRSGFVRQTASDRPGVAQPVPERDIPVRPWRAITWGALVLFLVLLGAWEWHWREFGAKPAYRNSFGLWAEQRRRINAGEGDRTVLIGSSRVLFGVQLPVWERLTGERPIQLSMEGTTPMPMLEDLAKDPDFTGRLLIGVAPDVFFSGFSYRGEVVPYFHDQGPSQRTGHWISKHLVEPWAAFYEPDFALDTVVRRQDWPLRPGTEPRTRVRKLADTAYDRNTAMWSKVAEDPAYRDLARRIWAEDFGAAPPGMDTPAGLAKAVDLQVGKAKAAIDVLRARGVAVVFVRMPSNGEYLAYEERYLPRETTWDVLLARTGVPGIHFQDHPELQGYDLPEWSHLSASEAARFTAQLVPLVEAEFVAQQPGRAPD